MPHKLGGIGHVITKSIVLIASISDTDSGLPI